MDRPFITTQTYTAADRSRTPPLTRASPWHRPARNICGMSQD